MTRTIFHHDDDDTLRVATSLPGNSMLMFVVETYEGSSARVHVPPNDVTRLRDALTEWLSGEGVHADPNACRHCAGHRGDPEDQGEWVQEAGAYMPTEPCPRCHGSGTDPFTPAQEDRIRALVHEVMPLHVAFDGADRESVVHVRAPRVHVAVNGQGTDVNHEGTDVWGAACKLCTHASGVHGPVAGCTAPQEGTERAVHCACTRRPDQCDMPVMKGETSPARLQPAVPEPVELVCCGHDHAPMTLCGWKAPEVNEVCDCRGLMHIRPEPAPVHATCTCHKHRHVETGEFFCGHRGCFCRSPQHKAQP